MEKKHAGLEQRKAPGTNVIFPRPHNDPTGTQGHDARIYQRETDGFTMTYPTGTDIYHLTARPEYYAEQMSIAEIDHVVSGFMITRHYKQRWSP